MCKNYILSRDGDFDRWFKFPNQYGTQKRGGSQPAWTLPQAARMELVGAYTPPCRERRRIPAGGYGVRIYYGLTGETSEAFPFRLAGPLKTAKVLPYSVFTKRKKGRFDFRPAIASRAGLPHGDGLSGGGRVF